MAGLAMPDPGLVGFGVADPPDDRPAAEDDRSGKQDPEDPARGAVERATADHRRGDRVRQEHVCRRLLATIAITTAATTGATAAVGPEEVDHGVVTIAHRVTGRECEAGEAGDAGVRRRDAGTEGVLVRQRSVWTPCPRA